MSQIVIGFTWEMGCGKDTATDYIFKNFGWKKLKYSQILRDVLWRIAIPESRENLQNLSSILRNAFWQDLLARIIANDVKNSNEEIIIIDWVRREDDIVYLRKLPNFKLIYIEADINNRFDRISKRWENTDDIGKTFEQFQKEQEFEAESQVRWLKEKAHYIIDNNWTFEDLYKQIKDIID